MCCIGADRDCCAGASSASLHSGIARNSCASHELRIKFQYTTWVQNNDIFVVDVLGEYVYTHKKDATRCASRYIYTVSQSVSNTWGRECPNNEHGYFGYPYIASADCLHARRKRTLYCAYVNTIGEYMHSRAPLQRHSRPADTPSTRAECLPGGGFSEIIIINGKRGKHEVD